ncbi:MAG TPA: LytR C-terminal domain-containing protein [Acidimicrobiales bacterium]
MEPDRPPAARPSPARGVVLIAVAVVLGLFLLRAIDDSDATSAADGEALEATDDGEASGDTGAGESDEPPGEPADGGTDGGGDGGTEEGEPPAPEPRTPGEITVIVLNGSGVQGAAGQQTETLGAAGYQTAVAANAPQPVAQTQVQHAEGFEAEAAVLAEELGVPGSVAPMSPDLGEVDLQGAQLVVLLGTDLASG